MTASIQPLDIQRPHIAELPPARLGLSYQIHVLAVLAALAAFFAFYLGTLAGAAYILYALVSATHVFEGGLVFWVFFGASTASALVVFLFLLKGLFKSKSVDRDRFVEITDDDEPRLFGFLSEICEEAGAKMPRRVYLCADVNAGVFYDSSILSLFWPVRKNLLIGLGLMNSLNLTELKAVLAHEFGHFSQRTMRISSYVYVVNSVFHHMIFGPDKIDELLARGRKKWLGLLGMAWVLTGLIWLIRRFLGLGLKLINVIDAALSRQMELHADRVAVRLTGSDAIVHALLKSDYAEQCYAQTCYDLRQASQKDLYTTDLFYHHSRMMEFMRLVKDEPTLGVAPQLPCDSSEVIRVFEPDAPQTISMWASHPSYAEREQNAKREYMRSPIDERSSWLLLVDAQQAREQVTRAQNFSEYGADMSPGDPHIVQRFIDDDHAEIILDRKYLGMYDNRFIEPNDIDALAAEARQENPDSSRLATEIEAVYGEELRKFMETFKARLDEMKMLQTVMGGHLQWGKTFVFRGEHYQSSHAQELFSQLHSEMAQDRQWFSELDQRVFLVHYHLASDLGSPFIDELMTRYHFHLEVQTITRELRFTQAELGQVIALLTSGQVDEDQVEFVFESLLRGHQFVEEKLVAAADRVLPALNNITTGTDLREIMLTEELISAEKLHDNQLDSDWLKAFLAQYEGILERLGHLRRKSLGGLLFLQEEIARQWKDAHLDQG
ncbi:MAG: M48 family metallopeptidase [Bradymonadaceae bacterium]